MEREEYKVQIEEIKNFIAKGQNDDALDLLDSMNWRKVRNVNALLDASKLYEALGKYDDSKEMLEEAHARSPIGRMIIYELAMICIKRGEYTEASGYYDAFVEIAPHDSMKYLIRYEMSKAKHADDDTLIAILEELKEYDFLEEWAFELACLYHKRGRIDQCIELCDEIALWFGDGPYVEKALEMKMLYSPLDKKQEDMYRHFRQRRDGITEIMPEDNLRSGEIVTHTITIPEISIPAENFNTVNLQAEIKKNIEEIMQATEAGEISENMENIKTLVGDLPLVQGTTEEADVAKAIEVAEKKIDEELKNSFQNYLAEEYDGQMSLFMPDAPETETQIKGQLTIEDIMADWDKTSRAVEAALQDAQQQKLDLVKAQALEEANQIMGRLEDVIPKLDAGATPIELMKEEILSAPMNDIIEEIVAMEDDFDEEEKESEVETTDEEETKPTGFGIEILAVDEIDNDKASETDDIEETVNNAEDEAEEEISAEPKEEQEPAEREDLDGTFKIPKVESTGAQVGVGMEIPVVHGIPHVGAAEEALMKAADLTAKEASNWEPKTLSTDEKALLDEALIEKNIEEPSLVEETPSEEVSEITIPEEEAAESVNSSEYEQASQMISSMNDLLQKEIDRLLKDSQVGEAEADSDLPLIQVDDIFEETKEAPAETIDLGAIQPELKSENMRSINIEDPNISELDELTNQQISDMADSELLDESDLLASTVAGLMNNTGVLPDLTQDLPDLLMVEDDEEPLPVLQEITFDDEEEQEEYVEEGAIEKAVADELTPFVLDEEEQDLFSYFLPIAGMEQSICQALAGAKERITNAGGVSRGHIIIEGNTGSGKTMLSSSIIKVLQKETGKPSGPVGKVDGDKLNNKNIQELFKKISGGCLIVEKAGELSKEKGTEIALLVENDSTGILLIFEDTKSGINKFKKNSPQLAKKFTEKITIPVFTIDELVEFAKSYAHDQECVIDDMGILSLYNRINMIQSLERPTSLAEIRDIVDEAIDSADKSGLKGLFSRIGSGSKKYTEDGYLILAEKDFDEA